MVNYQLGKVYKIMDNTNGNVYIGSTCVSLSQRLAKHLSKYKQYLKGKTNFVSSFDIIKNGNYDIVLIEKCPCNDKEELHKKERFYIESIDCINICVPSRTNKEYKENNIEKIKQYEAKYYEINKVQILQRQKQKYLCEICNCHLRFSDKARHERTQKHQDNLNKQ